MKFPPRSQYRRFRHRTDSPGYLVGKRMVISASFCLNFSCNFDAERSKAMMPSDGILIICDVFDILSCLICGAVVLVMVSLP